jgi:hypothetical protein
MDILAEKLVFLGVFDDSRILISGTPNHVNAYNLEADILIVSYNSDKLVEEINLSKGKEVN